MADDADFHAFQSRFRVRRSRASGAWRWPDRGVVTRQRLQQHRAILGGPGHRADMIPAEGGRRDAGAADETVGRLDAGDAAQRSRPADRAAGVGSNTAENQACGDRRTGAAAAAGGEMIRVPGVSRRRPRQIERGSAIGEFMRREFADQDRAGLGEPLAPAASAAGTLSSRASNGKSWGCPSCRRCP